ncbi:WD40 repeat-like protein [Trametes versicolor FP-101664 SS1]|uniref:WD40 repeat-like protein n=1 Tax=Trametes versicolor (strain FP-101664) TaxID=717944 RepID=UPI00046240A9|nr:WD40 repeat-like protein [Trametes versicolor FP-101664 SS1]EIW58666.1 WD40 repeat-like protein [Trametes versicolor FP-101664 SS1]
MHLNESILCATVPSTSGSGPGTLSLHDIQTGTSLATWKQTSAGAHCTAAVQSRDGQGGFMLAAQQDKSILNVYNFQKDQLALKVVLPEKLTAITVDPKGKYCAGATAQGRIFLWEIASGIMYNSWDAHYRQINVLRFTQDAAALVAGSEDSGVSVWSIPRLLDETLQNELPTPYCSFTDHTLPVTDVVCGVGAFPSCRILTASVDHTVKVWDPASKTLLTTFYFPQPIKCITWDPTERLFFAASADGSVHQVNLFRQREDKFSRAAMEAVGGAGVSDVIRINDVDPKDARKRLISVGEAVTTMVISLTGSMLLAGTSSGLIHIYDIASHQLLRTLSSHKGMTVTHISTMLRPPDLVGHISLTLGAGTAGDARENIPVRPVAPFQRIRDAKAREAHEVSLIIPHKTTSTGAFFSYSREELIKDHAFFVQPSAVGPEATGVSLQSRVSELESEVTRLREQLGKAKGINDVMWETVVQRMVAEGKEKGQDKGRENGTGASEEGAEQGEGGRRRKRNRT